MSSKTLSWLIMCALAICTHLTLASVFLKNKPIIIDAAEGIGEGGIEIGFGQLGSYENARKRAAEKQQEAANTTAIKKQEPLAQPAPQTKPKAVAKPIQKSIAQPVVVKQPEITKPIEQIVSKPQITEQQTVAKITEASAVADQPPSPPSANQQANTVDGNSSGTAEKNMALGTGRGSDKNLGGKKGTANRYFADLKHWLNRHKDYPAHLRKAKIQGVVTVRFTIDKYGNLIQSSIKKSSGHQDLDRAALQMLKGANPMPAIPAIFKREQLTIALPIDYALIDE